MDQAKFFNQSKSWILYEKKKFKDSLDLLKEEKPTHFINSVKKFIIIEQLTYKNQDFNVLKKKLFQLKKEIENKNYLILEGHIILIEGKIEKSTGQLNCAKLIAKKAVEYFKQMESEYFFGTIKANQLLMAILYDLGEMTKSKEILKNLLEIIKKQKRFGFEYVAVINALGAISATQGELKHASKLYTEALPIALKEEEYRTHNALLLNLGILSFRRGNYKKSKKSFKESIKQAEMFKFYDFLGESYLNLAILNSFQGDFEKSETNFDSALKIITEISLQRYPSILYEMAMHYRRKGDYKEAIDRFKLSIVEFRKNKIIDNEYVETLSNMAELYAIIGNYKDAYFHLNEANSIATSKKYPSEKIFCELVFARILLMKGEHESANFALTLITEQFHNEIDFDIILECKFSIVESKILAYQESLEIEDLEKVRMYLQEIIEIGEEKDIIPYVIRAKLLKAILEIPHLESREETISQLNSVVQLAQKNDITKLVQFGSLMIEDLQRKSPNSEELIEIFMNYFNSMSFRVFISLQEKELFNKISLILISQSDFGSEIIKSYNRPSELDEMNGMRVATFLSVSLGQGGDYHEGLFGPLPISSPSESLALIYSLVMKDESNEDKRLAQSNLILISLIIPEKIMKFFNDRVSIQSFFEKYFDGIKEISEITPIYLENFQVDLMNIIVPNL